MMTHYHAGWNMPGYMPEMDASYPYESAEDAKEGMIDDLLRHADQADMVDDHNNAETLSSLAEDLNLSDVSNGWDGWTDELHYWIEECDMTECENEEEYA